MAWRRVDAVWLDARLGARVLVKHGGLMLVGAFAMAIAQAPYGAGLNAGGPAQALRSH